MVPTKIINTRKPSVFGRRISQRYLIVTFILTVLTVHVLFLRYQTIITLNHTKIVQILTTRLGSRSPILPGSVRYLLNHRQESVEEKPVKILIWNKYWKSKALWHKVFTQIIHGQCPEADNANNCMFTMNRTELNTSDAVMFHLVDLHVNGNYELPATRRPEQLWIAMSYEPPFILNYLGLNASRLNHIFNRTMSYRADADITVRHGRYLKLTEHPSTTTLTTSVAVSLSGEISTRFPRYVANWIHSHDDPAVHNYAHGKRRLVAWFASSHGCTSHSRREHYVRQLQRYVPVDIYGTCGQYKCGVQKTLRNPYKVEHDDCYYLVSTGYKFVLAFENSICTDYITEKLYNNLMLNVVPVVLGGGNYAQDAPPHSVIDASKYSPKELAAYLKLLDKNDTAFSGTAFKRNQSSLNRNLSEIPTL